MTTLTKSHEKRKDDRLVARVSHEDKAVITKGAALAGQTVGGFLLEHARKAASMLIQERNVIRLNEAESRRLVEALLAPPRPPTEAMKRALKQYRETVISDVNPNSPALLAKRASAGKAAAR